MRPLMSWIILLATLAIVSQAARADSAEPERLEGYTDAIIIQDGADLSPAVLSMMAQRVVGTAKGTAPDGSEIHFSFALELNNDGGNVGSNTQICTLNAAFGGGAAVKREQAIHTW